jgi:hypothetical protein
VTDQRTQSAQRTNGGGRLPRRGIVDRAAGGDPDPDADDEVAYDIFEKIMTLFE